MSEISDINLEFTKRRENAYQIISKFIQSTAVRDGINYPQEGDGLSDLINRPVLADPRKTLGLKPSELSFFAPVKSMASDNVSSLMERVQGVKKLLDNAHIINEVKGSEGYSYPVVAITIDINQQDFDQKLARISDKLKDSTPLDVKIVSGKSKERQ